MVEVPWTVFCGECRSSCNDEKECGCFLKALYNSASCANNIVIVSVDILFLFLLLFCYFRKQSIRRVHSHSLQGFSSLQLISFAYNGCLGLVYLGLGVWILGGKLIKEKTLLPLHQWLMMLSHGLTWFLLALILSAGKERGKETYKKLCSVITSLFSGFLCVSSLLMALSHRKISVKLVLDALSFPGGILLVLCTFGICKDEERDQSITTESVYAPLNDEANLHNSNGCVTPFDKAGCLSKISFWWLNPLMRKGSKKILESEDLPQLRDKDRAETCYRKFMEEFNKQKDSNQSSSPSILWTVFLCHWKELLVSGFFALLKILNLSAGPLILKAFIEFSEGKGTSKNEGYILALLLFITKSLESVSQRQWYFRSRIIGLHVRSLLSTAIYDKQLRLSSAGKLTHSAGEIINYMTIDAYRLGELPYWFHQTWTTTLQLCITLVILYNAVGLATVATLLVIVLTVLCNIPLAKVHQNSQTKLMMAQDKRLKATTEALLNMKVLKLYAWETHFKHAIDFLRENEYKCLSAVQMQKAYYSVLFWTSPVFVSAATFGACYVLGIPLNASNVFTFVATLRLVQDPIRSIPDVIGVIIQARVALARIMKFLEAPVLQKCVRQRNIIKDAKHSILIKSAYFSWEGHPLRPILKNINLGVKIGQKVAICGEVGSGKSTLLAAILGEVPITNGTIQVCGRIGYVSQMAWIQTGTIQENILFGSTMEQERYLEVLGKCSLEKDLQMLPFGDQTEIGERGINLSGGQKQRIQLARALYKDADLYLLDDPFSAVDAHTAKSLFNEYVMGALTEKTVILVTHQTDFLPPFDSIVFMSDGEILCEAPFDRLLTACKRFQDLANVNRYTTGSKKYAELVSPGRSAICKEIIKMNHPENRLKASLGDQLIKQEEKERGDTGFKPYIQYLNQNKGFIYFCLAGLSYLVFVIGQIMQNSWMAAHVQKPAFSRLRLVVLYLLIGIISALFLILRCLFVVVMGLESSKFLFSQLMKSLFHAPMSFYDATPLGRILSRVSSDLSIVDLDVPLSLMFTASSTMNLYSSLGILTVFTWQVLLIALPMVFLTIHVQKYYFASAKELMRLSGTTKSMVANHLAESIAGSMTIRAFEEEDRFFSTNFDCIDANASPFFHNFAANEWLIQRLELFGAVVLSFSAFALAFLPSGTFGPGFIGMALSYGLSLNISLVISVQNQLTLANHSVSVERLFQYMHIDSEAPEIIEDSRPSYNWPANGKVEIHDLKVRYRSGTPLVICGISCTFEGGDKIGIVGRTGSGKTTLISSLFRLVEPTEGKIIIDDVDISKIGLHDLRSHLAIIPQDPTLFHGSVRHNLDPLSQYTDERIWEVLGKCQLWGAIQGKEDGLDTLVAEDGSNWSMGQRQLFCLGRALLRRSRILVLDEATASIDNATDSILQKIIRTEFADCTVITVAHRIPTVMDCTMVLAMSDGKIAEYDEPIKLMMMEGSLFRRLFHEYWSTANKSS
ncbi:hypothetical protein Sjap_005199 [Stephania japonica]|uniref:ABC transporter C family member 10 n=1 Tax=Stephania japonica TaxID=461633 RepID=A0AAP0K3T6_9MAGN